MIIRSIFNKFAFNSLLLKRSVIYKAINFEAYSILTRPIFTFCKEKQRPQAKQSIQRQMLSLDNNTNTDLNYLEIVSQYPYYCIPVNIIRNPSNYKLEQQQLKTLIALKSLQALPQDLRLAYSILFPNNINYKDLQFVQNQGRIMFSQYMSPNISQWIEAINNQKGSLDERVSYLIFMSYLLPNANQNEQIDRLDEVSIIKQDPHGVMAAYYISLLIKNHREYTHLLDLLLSKISQKSIDILQRVKICKAIIKTFKFQEKYPHKIIAATLLVLTESLPKLANYQLIYFIKLLYPYRSKESKAFAQNLKQFLIQKYSKGDLDYHVPLVLKVIKYCNKQGVHSENLVQFIIKNMKRFQVIFNRQNISKGLFFQLIFERYKSKDISPQMLDYLKKYFQSNLTKFSKAQEIEKDQMIRFSKLLLKYIHFFSAQEKQQIKQKYINQILPFYQNYDEILFYNILIYLRQADEQHSQKSKKSNDQIVKYIELYISKQCIRNDQGQLQVQSHINSVIEIMYQVLRHNIKIKKQCLPFICRYNFNTKDTISSEIVANLFFYLKKNGHEKRSDIKRVISEIVPLLQIFLKKKRINSIKTIFNIIDVCSQMDFQHDFFYKIIENSISSYLIQNPNFVIIPKDLEFLLEKLIKRGYGSRGLRTLINSSIKQPKNWHSLKSVYLENQKKFQQTQRANRQLKRNQNK